MLFSDFLIEKKYTVYKLSKESGIAKTTLFDIVSGKSKLMDVSGRVLYGISKCLKVSIEDILSLENTPYNPAYDSNLPQFLKEEIDKLKESRKAKSSLVDCYYDELNSSINVSETEQLISKEQANYLRKKYL